MGLVSGTSVGGSGEFGDFLLDFRTGGVAEASPAADEDEVLPPAPLGVVDEAAVVAADDAPGECPAEEAFWPLEGLFLPLRPEGFGFGFLGGAETRKRTDKYPL